MTSVFHLTFGIGSNSKTVYHSGGSGGESDYGDDGDGDDGVGDDGRGSHSFTLDLNLSNSRTHS